MQVVCAIAFAKLLFHKLSDSSMFYRSKSIEVERNLPMIVLTDDSPNYGYADFVIWSFDAKGESFSPLCVRQVTEKLRLILSLIYHS